MTPTTSLAPVEEPDRIASMMPRQDPGIDVEMARRLAHEVRSPLGVIKGGLDEILARDDLPADAIAYLAVARRATGRLQRLAERLEWVARIRIESEGVATREDDRDASTLPLGGLIEQAVRDAETHAGRRRIEVILDMASGGAGSLSSRRGPALARVIEELVHNAIQYARTRVVIAVERSEDELAIRIEHDGVPLAADGGRGRDGDLGLGLGLWIVNALAERVGVSVDFAGGRVTLALRERE